MNDYPDNCQRSFIHKTCAYMNYMSVDVAESISLYIYIVILLFFSSSLFRHGRACGVEYNIINTTRRFGMEFCTLFSRLKVIDIQSDHLLTRSSAACLHHVKLSPLHFNHLEIGCSCITFWRFSHRRDIDILLELYSSPSFTN